MKPEKIEPGQVWRNDRGLLRIVREVRFARDEVWFTSGTWTGPRDILEHYEFIGTVETGDAAGYTKTKPDRLEHGQVWRRDDDSLVFVITEVRGNGHGVVAPDHEMTLDYLTSRCTLIGHLADNWLIRARSATEATTMRAALRMQAEKMHAQGQKMIDDAKKLREAADLLEV